MTITTYYVTHRLGRPDADTSATIHLINDLTFGTKENRSWDATRALVDQLVDPEAKRRYGISIEAEQSELADED
ncbi:MAG: hypothetical protein KJ634_00685 [Gammaproteobacteria bacterium]|nr:hypothetical protein [Gammaproteobacteria bacterium]MBU1414116.1 hypothetical protein [Gammaproteobacteria bacterium]